MGLWVAFLRGINLGRRQMRMAELRTGLEAAGFGAVKTILASGNVRFEADGTAAAIRERLETSISGQFGYKVEAIMRSGAELERLLAHHPFGRLDPAADLARHVLLFADELPPDLKLADRPGDIEILRIDARELYLAAYRKPNGRYTEGVEEVLKPLYARLGKGHLDTMRNWNTMEKLLK